MPEQIKDDTLIFAEILTSNKDSNKIDIDIFASDSHATCFWVCDTDETSVNYAHVIRVPDNDKTVLTRVTTSHAFIYGEANAVYKYIETA